MLEENKTLEERMTQEERELYESFKSKIGQEFVPEPSHEMFFPLLNEEPVTWSRIKKWAKVNEDPNPLWFDDHGISAFIARYIGFLVHRQFNRLNVPFFIP